MADDDDGDPLEALGYGQYDHLRKAVQLRVNIIEEFHLDGPLAAYAEYCADKAVQASAALLTVDPTDTAAIWQAQKDAAPYAHLSFWLATTLKDGEAAEMEWGDAQSTTEE